MSALSTSTLSASTLSALGGTTGASASRGAGDAVPADNGTPGADDDAFARMVDPAGANNPAPPAGQSGNKPKPQADATTKGNAGKADTSPPAAGKPADEIEAPAEDAGTTEGAALADDETGADPPAWPPAGLAGLGLLPAAAPAATAPPVTDAAVAPALPATNPATGQADAAGALPTVAANVDRHPPQAGPIQAMAEEPPALAIAPDLATEAATDTAAGSAPPPDGEGFAALMAAPATAVVAKAEAAAPFAGTPTATPDLDSDDFGNAIGVRLGWLAEQKIGHAHININPDDLGPVEVRLQLDGDRVHASFSSAHADVRQALESSLPRLREMLGQQGLQLAQADVGRQQQENPGGQASAVLADADGLDGIDTAATLSPVALRLRGLLDAYA